MPMFDMERAYGLSLLISKVTGSSSVAIKDVGSAYTIECDVPISDIEENQKRDLETLFADPNKFNYSLATQLSGREAVVNDAKEVATEEAAEILKLHATPSFSVRLSTKKTKDNMTLYQSLDVTASKSFRELKMGLSYGEGGQLYVDKFSFSIALIGSAFFCHPKPTRDFLISIGPNPAQVNVPNHMAIQNDMKIEHLCAVSDLTVLSHYAVSLSLVLGERQEKGELLNSYECLVFNEMRRTGKQFKPSGGGRFPLEYCLNLSKSKWGMEMLRIMEGMFRRGFVKGNPQRLAFALAQFLSEPSLDNYSRYIDVHLRGYIEKDKSKRISNLYGKASLQEGMKFVESG
jgi:hypothetical protein